MQNFAQKRDKALDQTPEKAGTLVGTSGSLSPSRAACKNFLKVTGKSGRSSMSPSRKDKIDAANTVRSNILNTILGAGQSPDASPANRTHSK